MPTEVGEFRIAGYRSTASEEEFVALYKGELNPEVPTLACIHRQRAPNQPGRVSEKLESGEVRASPKQALRGHRANLQTGPKATHGRENGLVRGW